MDMFVAMIQPSKLDDVKTALVEICIRGITVTGVKGFGRQQGRPPAFLGLRDIQGKPFTVDLTVRAAQTEKIGDGKVFILPGLCQPTSSSC